VVGGRGCDCCRVGVVDVDELDVAGGMAAAIGPCSVLRTSHAVEPVVAVVVADPERHSVWPSNAKPLRSQPAPMRCCRDAACRSGERPSHVRCIGKSPWISVSARWAIVSIHHSSVTGPGIAAISSTASCARSAGYGSIQVCHLATSGLFLRSVSASASVRRTGRRRSRSVRIGPNVMNAGRRARRKTLQPTCRHRVHCELDRRQTAG
jgi:hypothetical protein